MRTETRLRRDMTGDYSVVRETLTLLYAVYKASIRIRLEQQEFQFASAPRYIGFSADDYCSGASHRAPPQVADRGRLARYGGYRGNKIPGADQTQPLLPCSVGSWFFKG
jgi:hypothetical protein